MGGDVLGLAPDVVGRDPPLGEDEMDVTGTAIAGAVDFSRWGPGELNEALFFSGLEDNQNEDSLDRFLSLSSAQSTRSTSASLPSPSPGSSHTSSSRPHAESRAASSPTRPQWTTSGHTSSS